MASSGHRSRRSRSAYGIELSDKSSDRRGKKGKKKNWENRIRKLGGGFLIYLFRRTVAATHAFLSSAWILSMPFMLLLMVTSTDFLVLTTVDVSSDSLFFDALGINETTAQRDEAELQKAQLLQYVYLFVFLLSLVHWRQVIAYLKQWSHLLLLGACLLFTALYSIEPIKVLTNTTLIFVGLLSAILFAAAHAEEKRYQAVYAAVFVPMLILHLVSLLIFFAQDTDLIEFVFSSRRYGGLAGNPNSLGATAVLGYWAASCFLVSQSVRFAVRLIAAAAIVLFLLHVAMSGSGTATSAIVLVTLLVFWLRILAAFKPVVRHALNAGAVVFLVLMLIAVVISSTPADIYLSVTESLGKDSSLTGRTELWSVARDAISTRPFLGWGFDSHITVMAEVAYDIEFNHYHNGFLDTLVAGGALLLLIVIYNLGRFARAFFVAFRKDPNVFPLIVPLLMLLFLNVSEYSLLRPNSPIWSIYVVAFVMLTYQQSDRLISRFTSSLGGPRSKSRSRKRQLRWA